MLKLKSQKGETIVEVMIAIVIIASALGGAFSISNRSTRTLQADKERYQAQLYANAQATFLHTYALAGKITPTGDFCMKDATTATANAAEYTASCVNQGVNNLYTIKVSNGGSAGFHVYHINISWDSVISSSKDQVDLYYGT